MQINFSKCTIAGVSEPHYYDNPRSLDSKTYFNITICSLETVNSSGQVANVNYDLSYCLPGRQPVCGFMRGDVVDITATLRGRWNNNLKRVDNELCVNNITKVNS